MTGDFAEGAAAYAVHRPTYPGEVVDYLAGLASHRDAAWDAGCGSGQLSVGLARRFARVYATDASAEQIAYAVPHPAVEYRIAAAEASGLPDGAVDLAVAAQAAHWFDLQAYYAEVRRVTRPRGIVALIAYALMNVDAAVDPVIRHFYSTVLARFWAPERRHVEDGYRSLPFPFDELPAPRFEMRATWRLGDVFGYVETWSAVRALGRALGRTPIEAFRDDLARAWGEADGARSVRWTIALRVGRVR